jgi:2-desacetyl-2-hydroxyethyl bacteriochlorophyllide A dehydrogenase
VKTRQLWFTEIGKVEIREAELAELKEDQVQVRALASGISAGTEMLAYRGLLPKDLPLDISISTLQNQSTSYPFQYGYACVGLIEQVGHEQFSHLLGKKVFAFHPHCSHFIASPKDLILLRDDMPVEAGIFLANMETAMSLLIDGELKGDETVAIMGLGVVGQLLAALLASEPVEKLVLIDSLGSRRKFAELNAFAECLPSDQDVLKENISSEGVELIYELSGNPEALNTAIELAKFAGKIVVGSWYGNKPASLNLGGKFHRNRLKIISSQVSSIDPAHLNKWSRESRLQKALESIPLIKPERFITHQYKLDEAEKAYQLLDKNPEQALQVVFHYED